MNLYSQMTDMQVNRLIAEREGYRVIRDNKGYVLVDSFGREYLGGEFAFHAHRRNDADSCWADAPHWCENMREAITLFESTDGEELVINYLDMELIADWFTFHDDERFKAKINLQVEDGIARAICECYLQLSDKRKQDTDSRA